MGLLSEQALMGIRVTKEKLNQTEQLVEQRRALLDTPRLRAPLRSTPSYEDLHGRG